MLNVCDLDPCSVFLVLEAVFSCRVWALCDLKVTVHNSVSTYVVITLYSFI